MQPKTISIIAFAHSGTTMTAGIFEALGVPMTGPDFLMMNWEDQRIIQAIKDEQEFADLVNRRDARNLIWGFKHPGANSKEFLARMDRHLRNPVYFAIWKDPVSVTQRRAGHNYSLKENMAETCERMARVTTRIHDSGLPVHMLSYTRAIVRPRWFVERLVELSDLEPSEKEIQRAVDFIRPNTTNDLRRRYPQVKRY